MSVLHRIERLLDGGQCQEIAAPDAVVATLREKAVASARNARDPTRSPVRARQSGPGSVLRRFVT